MLKILIKLAGYKTITEFCNKNNFHQSHVSRLDTNNLTLSMQVRICSALGISLIKYRILLKRLEDIKYEMKERE